jgi:hypothetical protein
MLGATLIFNLIDLVLTLCVVLCGLAAEANPVMANLLAAGPIPFAIAKMALVSTGVLFLWKERARPIAKAGGAFVFTVYGALMVYHLQSVRVLLA